MSNAAIPLRWVTNSVEGAKFAFGPGRVSPDLTYLGAPIDADFPLTYEALAPYVTECLDQAAAMETVHRVEIRNGTVRVVGVP